MECGDSSPQNGKCRLNNDQDPTSKIKQPTSIYPPVDLDESSITNLKSLLKEAIETQQDADGFANLANVGSFIQRIKPDFDPRIYGGTNKKLGDLVKKQVYLDNRMEGGVLYIRFKEST